MITQKYLSQCFHYNPESGSLTWKERPRSHFKTESGWLMTIGRDAGKEAGSKNDNGYIIVMISGQSFRAHRIIWMLIHGVWPDNVDHINGIRSDNRIINLRDVSHDENCKNSSLRSDNSSGIPGVNWNKNARKWHSRIQVDGKMKHLGYFDDFDMAIDARKNAERKSNFHENHGKSS